MDASYQFQQIRFFVHEDGLVPVVEEVSGTPVASIERPGITRQEASHGRRHGPRSGPDQEVQVGGEQRPGDDGEACLGRDGR
jgi:hypothetical protein